MSMSMYANRADYEKARVARNLNPHKAARFASWFWCKVYAESGMGVMDFWDSLTAEEQQMCRYAVEDILKARDE